MIRKITASLMIAAFTSFGAHAVDLGDIGLEVTARSITMPNPDRGVISFKNCSSCSERELTTTPYTTYEIGELQVRRDDFRSELLRRPNQVMLLQLTPDRQHVARLKIAAAAQ